MADPGRPLQRLEIRSASQSEDLGLLALADAALAIEGIEDARLIGGQMLYLHALRWGLDILRETKDADIGIPEVAVDDPGIRGRLEALHYRERAGGEFVRPLPGSDAEVAIDVLVPARTSRARESVRIRGSLTTTEVLGLFTAMSRPAVTVDVEARLRDGGSVSAAVPLPDEAAVIVLRAYAWQKRLTETDAQDILRSLEIANAAGVTPQAFVSEEERRAVDIVWSALDRGKGGVLAVLGGQGARARALATKVLG